MKHIYLILFAFLSVTFAKAQSFTYNGINYNVTDATNFYVEVGINSGFSGAANIPSNVVYNSQNYTVTEIGYNAFYSCNTLTSISIPNSVTNIGHGAFANCTSLNSVSIPNSVTNIEGYAFYHCYNLTSITLPNTLTTIKEGVFYNCSSLNSIVIPNSVTYIGESAFFNCASLASITIPSSVTTIYAYAFTFCVSLNSVTVEWQNPLSIHLSVFQNVNINSATLNVPFGTVSLYEDTPVWTEFNIVAGPEVVPRGCWAEISAGGQHTLAIAQDGTLWAWGDNSYGQLGNNLATGIVTNPLQISNEPNWVFVSAGEFYSLAIKKNGTLWVWGRNTNGQLGNGNTTQQNVPFQIGVDTDWVGVYAGYAHSMARKSDNTLWGWGNNTYGQLGINSTATQQTPTQVGLATNWQKVSLGRNHTVALTNNGELWVWGRNTNGQLGLGNYTNQLSPIRLGDETWKVVEAGDYHNIAIKSNNALYSWGDNFSGQLGLGDTTERNAPTQIGVASDWKSIAAGLYNSYAVKSTGTLWACGDNFKGQIGNGNFIQQNGLLQAGTATDWYDVVAGNEYAVAQKTSGTFYSWGDNQSGQLGNGSTLPNTTGQNTPGIMGCAGNILDFDGVDDTVIVTNNGTDVLGDNTDNGSYTFEMKVKLNDVASNEILGKMEFIPSFKGFGIYTDASGYLNFVQVYGSTLSTAISSSPLVVDTWYRIVATFDYTSKTHKLYINGNLIDSKTETGTPNFSTINTGIGYYAGTSAGHFDGQINDIRVWKVARTPQEVASYTRNSQTVNSGADLIAHYKFNQGIANANNLGLTTLANEVLGGPVGTLQNFALTGATSNWTQDVTANETLDNNSFIITDTVLVYPNPSTGIFNLSLKENATIKLFDLLGKEIVMKKLDIGNSSLDISAYQAGIYLLQINSENSSIIKKIVKE
jgi:alpha-tubulin suppressor-like RCC1 family protein